MYCKLDLALTETKIDFPWICLYICCINFTLDNSNLPLIEVNVVFLQIILK